jgi:type IV pilus assembly protein PilM
MAHKILGIDLGAYSVKVAELEAGFRQSQLVGFYERTLLPANEGESELQRAARTLASLISDEKLEAEMVATTLGGEATLRLLSLPFGDRKKIEQVLGYELESQILGEVEGLVIDFVIAGAGPNGTNVIAVAAPKDDVKARIDALAQVRAEPRVVGAAALSFAALRGHSFEVGADAAPQMVIDVGHRHTHVCVLGHESVLFARTIPRGGEDVTRAIIDGFKMSEADATTAKHNQAFILGAGGVAETPAHRRVDQTVREAVRPLVRELRQTLAAYRAGGGGAPSGILLTGGGARLRGFAEHLEAELGMPVGRLQLRAPADDPFVAPELRVSLPDGQSVEDAASTALPSQALGLALAAAAPVPQVNLRKGELSYRSDFSYLRGKAGWLTVAVMAVLLCAALNAVAALRGSRKEAEGLELQLKRATRELFGEEKLDGAAVSEELRAGPKGGAPPVPTLSAYDVLDEISRHVPAADKGKLDVLELDIKPRKTYLKATAESVQQIDDLQAALEKIDCFEKIERGKISSTTVPPSGDNPDKSKSQEEKQFTFTINTTCP